jgi:hypothetical protein
MFTSLLYLIDCTDWCSLLGEEYFCKHLFAGSVLVQLFHRFWFGGLA